jgi:hypothetical protein
VILKKRINLGERKKIGMDGKGNAIIQASDHSDLTIFLVIMK